MLESRLAHPVLTILHLLNIHFSLAQHWTGFWKATASTASCNQTHYSAPTLTSIEALMVLA